MKKTEIDLENWALLLKTYNKIMRKIRRDLKDEDYPPLEWYDILWVLERQEKHKLRLQDLGAKVDLEKYNVTRIVDKLVEEKLVNRVTCDDDKRGAYAVITEKGLKLRVKMWERYRKAIHEYFGKHLNHEESSQLYKILQTINEQ